MKHIKQYIEIAKVWATASTCARLHVGAVIVANDRILATGYNGTAAGCAHHCKDIFYNDSGVFLTRYNHFSELRQVSFTEWKDLHHKYAEKYEIHAEQNAIFNMLKTGTNLVDDATLICTHEPCIHCAKAIVSVGIKSLIYLEPYDRSDGQAFNYLTEHNVHIQQYKE